MDNIINKDIFVYKLLWIMHKSNCKINILGADIKYGLHFSLGTISHY